MILLIDTTDPKEIFIGLIKSKKLVASKKFKAQFKQAEKLLPQIDKLLAGQKCQLKAIKGLGVVSGPGSFTALRIGVVTANALAYGLKIPVVGLKKTEFSDINQLILVINKKLSKSKGVNIIEPFYGQEPRIHKSS